MTKDVGLFKVTDVVKRTTIDKEGNFVEYYDVYFTTKSGINSSVSVPVKAKKEEVEKIIRQEAEKLEYIRSLKL